VVTVEARLQESRGPVFPVPAHNIRDPVNATVGTGLIVDTVGHILTVVDLVDGRDDFRVHYDDRNIEARLIGVDRRHDLAVLKIDTPVDSRVEISPYPPFPGSLVLAYGRAVGGTGYPSLGIIAGRQSDGSFLVSGSAIPGTPGGGIFDLAGRLIGIIGPRKISVDDVRRGSWEGIVMIPTATAFDAADRIICCGSHAAGYLGVRTTAIELVSAGEEVLGEAVVVSDVEPNSPADRAGLRSGDIITRVSYQNVVNDRQLQRMVSGAGADSTITIDLIRAGQNLSMRIPLTAYDSRIKNVMPYTPTQDEINTRLVAELQQRINLMKMEMERLQRELNRLLGGNKISR
jgi:S1-C subfamily serine protease/uncharacterized small protein (DUF1192 family)